jgi:hypothetical protein
MTDPTHIRRTLRAQATLVGLVALGLVLPFVATWDVEDPLTLEAPVPAYRPADEPVRASVQKKRRSLRRLKARWQSDGTEDTQEPGALEPSRLDSRRRLLVVPALPGTALAQAASSATLRPPKTAVRALSPPPEPPYLRHCTLLL